VLLCYERSQLLLHRCSYDEAAIRRYRRANDWQVAKHSLWTSGFRRKRRAGCTAVTAQSRPLVWSWRTTDRDRRTAAVRAYYGRRRRRLRRTRTATGRRTRPAPRKRTTKRFSWCVCVVHCVVCTAANTLKRHIIIQINITRQGRRTDGGRRVTLANRAHSDTRCTSATDCRSPRVYLSVGRG